MPAEKNRYLSILKQKAGEIDAVRQLAVDTWDRWNPLFELLSLELAQGETVNDLITRSIGGITQSCRQGATIFLDFEGIDIPLDDDIAQFVEGVLNRLVANGLIPVPVVHLDSAQGVINGARNFIGGNGRVAAIRVFFSELTPQCTALISNLVASLNAQREVSYFLLDLGEIGDAYAPQIGVALPPLLVLIPSLNEWASFSLIGTGIPRILGIASASNALLSRTEWDLFNQLRPQIQPLVRRLDFGDYAICNPDIFDFDPVTMQVSPKILYTIDESWIVYKGRSTKINGWDQTRTMCEQLSARPEFLGAGYSYGSGYIVSRAQGAVGPGNGRTWKKVGTNHHITFVANQVANLPGF